MLTIAGGIIIGFLGVCAVILLISVLFRTAATPDLIGGIKEGWQGFKDGMKKP